MSAKNSENPDKYRENQNENEIQKFETQEAVIDEKLELNVDKSESDKKVKDEQVEIIDAENLKLVENSIVEEPKQLENCDDRLTDILEESEDGEVEKKSNVSIEEIKDNISNDSFEEIDLNGENVKKVDENLAPKQDEKDFAEKTEDFEKNLEENTAFKDLKPKIEDEAKTDDFVDENQQESPKNEEFVGENQEVEPDHQKSPGTIKIPEVSDIPPVTPMNTPQAETFLGAPAIIQVSEILSAATAAVIDVKDDEDSKNDERNESDDDSDREEIKDGKIDKSGNQRNSFRHMKKRRHQTTSIQRPRDIKIFIDNVDDVNNENINKGPEKPPRKSLANDSTPTSSSDVENLMTPGEPGPEEFHEIAIDVPSDMDKEGRHISFDLTDHDGSASSKNSFKQPEEDEDKEEPKVFEKSRLEKFLNYIFCRKDLAGAKLSEKPVKFWALFHYGNRFDMVMVIIALILAACCGVCQPLFAVLSGRLANTLLLIEVDDPVFFQEGTETVILFVIIGLLCCVLAFAQFCCFNIACTRITRRIRNAYLKSILRQNVAWFEKNHSGALNTKLNDNIERIYEGIGDKLGLLTRNGVQYVTGIIVALITSWEMTLPLLLFSPIIAFLMGTSSQKISKASKKEMAVYATAGSIAEEAVTAYRTVAAFNAQDVEVKRYKTELEKGLKAGLRKGLYSGALTGILIAMVMLFMGVALLYGTFLYSIDVIKNPGQIFTVLMAIMSGAYHLGNASPHLMVLLSARVSAATVYKTIERVPKIDPYSSNGRKIYDVQGKIIFKNVSFCYPTRPDTKVLKTFSFSVNPGQTVALVGYSGSGKSTVVGILNRLYEFGQGMVTIDGVDIRELNVRWLRTIVGTVQQEPIIFNDTVEANIKIGNSTLTDKDMVEACKMANAHEFIELLPDGYNTRIGDGGVQLSGGQKQRIAIARTLARNPKILLLDEATSALDTHSEALVQLALNNACKNRTTIIIAHRLSTIRDADRIIVMNKGRFLESGTHNDLLKRKSAYFRLVKAQELDMGDKTPINDEEFDPEALETPSMAQPALTLNALLPSKEVRESIRQSFQRDFMPSEHLGDAECQELEIKVTKAGIKPASFAEIFADNREVWSLLAGALGVCVFNALSMPLNALVYGKSFELFKDGRKDNLGEAAIFFVFFFIIGIVAMVASLLTTYLFGKIGETVTMNMRVRAFRNIMYQDGTYFDNPAHTPGKLISRLATDAPNVKASMDIRLGRVTQGIMSLIAAIIISLFIDWIYALACSASFIVLGSFQFFVAKVAHSKAVKFAQSDEAGRIAIEAIENVRTIQLLTAEWEVTDRFGECALKRQKAEVRKAPIEALNFATTHGLQYFTLAFSYFVGFIFVTNDLTDKVAFFQVSQTLYFGAVSLMMATEFFPEFVKSRLAASLMYNIINREPKTGNPNEGEKISLEGEVKFENVYFAYPMRPKSAIMRGISLQARPGQTLALVGPSGSGKSTVISLLERVYDPSVGTILLDGKDLKTLCLNDVRHQMSLVEQMPRLFSGTIKENIAYGLDLDKVSMDEIVDAARIANISSFISSLPLGYDTPLGEKGTQLSGGQKQRIAIARAMIRKPKILLLDEATSALDSAAEKAVQEALDRAREGRTCITIAHRLSSIQNSDQIVFVENGKVRERGNHSQLLQMKGRYYNLIQKQNLRIQ